MSLVPVLFEFEITWRTVPVTAASFLRTAVCPAPFADVTENTFALISCVATIKFCSEKIF